MGQVSWLNVLSGEGREREGGEGKREGEKEKEREGGRDRKNDQLRRTENVVQKYPSVMERNSLFHLEGVTRAEEKSNQFKQEHEE